MFSRRTVMAGAVAASFLSGGRARGAVTPPSLYEILKEPDLLDAALSPSGKQIAILGQTPEGSWFKTSILLLDADRLSEPGRRLDLGDAMDIERIAWANDDRLLVWLKREYKMTVSGPGTAASQTDLTVRRMLSIGADGSKPVMLFENKKKDFKGNTNLGMVVDFLPDDPDHILMQAADYDRYVWALYRVNVVTGAAELVERGSDFTVGWASFGGVTIGRYETNARDTMVTLSTRAPGETAWTPYRKMRRGDHGRIEFDIVGVTEDPNVALVVTGDGQPDGGDAVQTFDLRTRQITGLVRKAERPIEDVVVDASGRFFAAAFYDDRLGYEFADPTMKAPFRALDGYFKKSCNVAISDMDRTGARFLLRVSGPQEPGAWYFYDRASKRLDTLGAARDWLSPERLAAMEALSITTRDGQALRAYLTVPVAGESRRPLVVMPHGGPEVRDYFAWDDWAQALAARGWLVLQPNFRGSDGYGRAFKEAGWGQWGGRMQEDVEDCVAHVVASGRVDPGRIAIMGASYGGYSALMGAVRKPGLYKAVVSIAGVSDLPEMMASEKLEGFDSPSYLYWKKSIGDPDTDRAKLEAASPRRQAAQITDPVLLIHGKEDKVVPPEQSKIMRDALRKAGKSVEYLEIPDMGHSGWKPQQSQIVLTRAIDFLAARLKA